MDITTLEKIEEFYLMNELAQTKFSKVFLGITSLKSLDLFAVKKIITEIVSKDFIENLKLEAKLLFSLQHKNIVRLIKEIQGNTHLYFVLEYCEIGDGFDFLKRFTKFFKMYPTQRIIQKIIKSITEGVIYLHQNNILHRDLKLKNVILKYKDFNKLISQFNKSFITTEDTQNIREKDIKKYYSNLKEYGKNLLFEFKNNIKIEEFEDFFCENIDIKLIDLGVSKSLRKDEVAKSIIFNDYSAPEMRNKKGYAFPSDFWNIGAIAYCLMTGKIPSILKNNNEEIDINERFVSSIEIIDFINCLLQKDPMKRLNEKNILLHPFLSKDFRQLTVQNCNFKLNINRKENLCGVWENVEFNNEKDIELDTVFIENFTPINIKMPIIDDYYDNIYMNSKK